MTSTLSDSVTHPDTRPLVYCILVNWNGWRDTVSCLRVLAEQDYSNFRVLVVDNGSTDDSVERIREACPQIEIVGAQTNRGFSAGCNLGIRMALAMEAEFVWLLNGDTLALPETLTQLLATAQPKIGITGTVLRYMHDPSQVQAWGGGNILRWLGYATHFTGPADMGSDTFLTFASVLIRREVFDDIGLMDERYFMYFDDADFCFRARAAGWALAVARDTAVLHKEGGSTHGKNPPAMDRIVTASGLRFLSIYAPVPAVAMTLFVLSKLLKRLIKGDFPALQAVVRGVGDWRRNRSAVFSRGT